MRRAVVVGRAACVMDDYAGACELCSFDEVIVIGKMGEVFPGRIDHWVSFHADLFDRWARTRAAAGLPPATRRWAAIYKGKHRASSQDGLSFVICEGGSSGFMGIQVAEALRCTHVVLAGVPMSAEGGHFAGAASPKEIGSVWGEAKKYWEHWESNAERLRPLVRSMSGRTRDLLGEPTREWLCGS